MWGDFTRMGISPESMQKWRTDDDDDGINHLQHTGKSMEDHLTAPGGSSGPTPNIKYHARSFSL